MRLITNTAHALAGSSRGATSVEYALILAFLFLAMVASVATVGDAASGLWSTVSTKVRASAEGRNS